MDHLCDNSSDQRRTHAMLGSLLRCEQSKVSSREVIATRAKRCGSDRGQSLLPVHFNGG
jgi:hypothetical protein